MMNRVSSNKTKIFLSPVVLLLVSSYSHASPRPPLPIPAAQSPDVQKALEYARDCFARQSFIVKQSGDKATFDLEKSEKRPVSEPVRNSVANYVKQRQNLYKCIESLDGIEVTSKSEVTQSDGEVIQRTKKFLTDEYFSQNQFELRLLISYVDPLLRIREGQIIYPLP